MASILKKMKREPESSLQSVLEITQSQIMTEARSRIQPELDRANSAAVRATNRADVAEAECRAAESKLQMVNAQVKKLESQCSTLQGKVEHLNKQVLLEQKTAIQVKADGDARAAEVEGRLNEEREKRADLAVEVGTLKGQLTKASKKTPPAPIVMPKPRPIPEFIIEDFKRGGPGDKIVSVRVKPVRAN